MAFRAASEAALVGGHTSTLATQVDPIVAHCGTAVCDIWPGRLWWKISRQMAEIGMLAASHVSKDEGIRALGRLKY